MLTRQVQPLVGAAFTPAAIQNYLGLADTNNPNLLAHKFKTCGLQTVALFVMRTSDHLQTVPRATSNLISA